MIKKYTLSSSVFSSHTSSFNPYFRYYNSFRKGTQIMNIIFKRKSVRTYLDIDVDDASVEQIIRAGMAAPSAKNQRPWEFYVVRNKETLAKLATCTPYSRPVANAPVAIVACYRTNDLFAPLMPLLDM